MNYFDCFVAASWMFVIGWFLGAIYIQNQNEKVERSRPIEDPEPLPNRATLHLATANAGD
jgi:hypothetical protein